MIGNGNDGDESPKRRSTFYVSLENESRQNHGKLNKCLSQDSDKFTCNTFPISNTKNTPSTMLTRTLSNSNVINKKSNTTISPTSSTSSGTIAPSTRGKVQSLTRMFETPQIVVETSSIVDDSATTNNNTQRKKVERTRSFKTIERFQNRFVGKRDTERKDSSRLNNTIGCLDTAAAATAVVVVNREAETTGCERRKKKDDVRNKFLSIQGPNRQLNNNNINNNNNANSNNNNINSKANSNNKSNNENENNNSGLTNLLIRRTHSTKIARSASALVKSGGRHASIDCPVNLSNSKNHLRINDSEIECGNNNDGANEDVDESAFEETDAAIHSGKIYCKK
ncbi:hypothetical protein PV326_002611 [Microctonus aethiopoides]|nr:hypothetical protein PV326_002611 [Microctonus aethiopoides]